MYKRKFQCFCCGHQFDIYEEYRLHIINNHEEGRDYIECPVPHCKAPVRDVKSHFKIKHPGIPLPKSCPMRAMIWRDFDKRKIKRPKFESGFFPSTKNGIPIKYRSGYEKRVYECLEKIEEISAYQAEPMRVKYFYKGKDKTYIPDLLVKYNDGRIECWEIKPSNQSHFSINEAKWKACEEYCKYNGWEFKVITEQGINKLFMHGKI